ncbi:MAG: hypothetical protein IJI25_06215 [Eubacterium sp.]|nr:hypothetical protein [Eubacterium sp.]
MISINDMTTWTAEYFALPENQKKAEKACDRYDRLMVKNIRRMMSDSSEQISIADAAAHDPGKVLEKARYETLRGAVMDGKKGSIKVDLVYQKAEFIPE